MGFDFRNTLAFVTDAAGDVFVPATGSSYTLAQGWGYSTGTAATGRDVNASLDPRLAGSHSVSSRSATFRRDLANGNYNVRLAAGTSNVASRQQINIWDGGLYDGATKLGSAVTTWAASTVIASGKYVILNGMILRTDTGGTSGATFSPTGNGPWTDGTITWVLVKKAILTLDSTTQVSTTSVMDAVGTVYPVASWPGGNTMSAPVAVTQGFVEVTRGNDDVSLGLRYLQFVAAPTALQDLTVSDRYGTTTATPTLYAKQPAGSKMLAPHVATGASDITNYSLSGDLAPYLDLATIDGVVWVVAGTTPIPDSMAGTHTVIITQTDTSSAITGSPHPTTITCTVVSSQGKPTDKSLYGMISTEAWLMLQPALIMRAAEWNPNPTVFALDQTATSPADLQSKMDAITPDGTSWYRIKLGGTGNWATLGSVVLPNKNFYGSGSGGLLIEPAPGFTDLCYLKFSSSGTRGVYIRNLKLVPGNGGSYDKAIIFNPALNGIYTIAKIEGNDIGRAFIPGFDPVADYANFQGAIYCYHAEQFIAVNNRLWGVDTGEAICAARYARTANDIRMTIKDVGDQAAFYRLNTPFNVMPAVAGLNQNDCVLIRESSHQTTFDHWDATTPTHPDYSQSVLTDQFWGSNQTKAIGDQVVARNGRIYTAASAGVTGVTEPIHTSGTVSDGGVNWTFSSYVTGSAATRGKQYVYLIGGHGVVKGTTVNASGTGPDCQLFLDSSHGIYTTNILALNVIWSTASSYGTANNGYLVDNPGQTIVEFCTLVGSPGINSAQDGGEKVIGVGGDDYGLIIARNNIVGYLNGKPDVQGLKVLKEGNIAVEWNSTAVAPFRAQDQLIGTTFDVDSRGRTTYPLTDDLTVSAAQMRKNLEGLLLTPTRLVGARTKLLTSTGTLTETLSGATGSPKTTTPLLTFTARP